MKRQDRQRKRIRLPKETYRQGYVFSLTIATHERYTWFERHEELTRVLQETIIVTAAERESLLFAWCIMPEHLHALVQDDDAMDFVRLIKGRSVPAARRYDRPRKLWQRSFFDHALRDEESIEHAARYILDNPVRAGLVEHATDYRWSGSLVWPQWREHDWATISDVA